MQLRITIKLMLIAGGQIFKNTTQCLIRCLFITQLVYYILTSNNLVKTAGKKNLIIDRHSSTINLIKIKTFIKRAAISKGVVKERPAWNSH